jgi:hypothetical protein
MIPRERKESEQSRRGKERRMMDRPAFLFENVICRLDLS